MQNLNIKNYSDFRSYLNDFLLVKQKQVPQFSIGMWTKQLGLKNTSSLSRILNGQRDPGNLLTEKICSYFKFSVDQKGYFEDLVRLSKYKEDIKLKFMLMERMGREHPDASLMVIDDRSSELISHWFCQTLREMTKLKDFQEDPEWIKHRLIYPVSTKEILWAIDICLHQGLLKRTKDGVLKASEGLLHTTNDIASKAIRKYHETTLEFAKKSLENTAIELREVTAETLTISSTKIPEAKEFIRNMKAKFVRMFEEQRGDCTFQLQIQLFPLTTTNNKDKNNEN